MSKNVTMSGKKLKNVSDPTLAHPHSSGSTVTLIQSSIDRKWGRYFYTHYRRYGLLLQTSIKYYKATLRNLEDCRSLPIEEKTGFRVIPEKLKLSLEINSIQFIVLTKLGLEYLYEEYRLAIEQVKQFRNESFNPCDDLRDISQKIKHLKEALFITSDIPQQLYILLDRRDIIEHPTQKRLYNVAEGEWKNVHLAWVLSGEIEGIIDPVVEFINELITKAEKYIKDNPIPGTLTGLKRGIKAGEVPKKHT